MMMTMKASVVLVSVFILTLFVLVPVYILSAQVDFTGPIISGAADCEGFGPDGCNFCNLLALAKNVINFLIYFSATVATLMLVYAGTLYVTAAANPSQIERAKKIFWSVIIGFIFIATAWFIVDAILVSLSGEGLSSLGPWNSIQCGASVGG